MNFQELNSVGYLSQRFGISPRVIGETFTRLAIEPAVVINGVAFYSESQCGHLHCELINCGALEMTTIEIPATVELQDAEEATR